MKNILLAVDDTRSSIRTCEILIDVLGGCLPEHVVLLYVEKIEGGSIMDDLLLSDSEVNTLRKSLQGTEHQEMMDKKARKILEYYAKMLAGKGISAVKKIVRAGHPAEEIMAAAEEEKVGMIVMGSRSQRLHTLFMGSVSREVANNAKIPVLLLR
ncbi:MAG: universal stress protein [Proteobacteria bacterium]|nr:universal stress protein [Pseudomonadota bacterium]MBU1736934.1 universal stress protein [Pseudomonadota bacterium]